jgi:hypothetical protein
MTAPKVEPTPQAPTLPVEVNGKWYDVPIPVQVHMVALEDERDAFKTAMHEEIAENLRLRELGGAHKDENMVAFIERLIREATPQAPAVAVPHGWQLVPKNATNDMLRPFVTVQDMGHAEAWASWQAALAAAPQPPAQPQAHADLREALRNTLLIAETLDKRPRPLCRDCADNDGVCPTTGMPCDTRAVFAAARAALSAPPPAQAGDAPEGWKCVPLEPTKEMVNAPNTVVSAYAAKLVYQRMLAASPSPAASAGGEEVGCAVCSLSG